MERIRRAAEADLASWPTWMLVHLSRHVTWPVAAAGTRMGQRLGRLELEAAASGNGAAVYPSKKAHLLALYRQHGEYGRREAASRVAGELAEAAGLQPGTARAYVYEELARLAGDSDRPARTARPG